MEMPDTDSAVPQSPVSGNVPCARGLPLAIPGTSSTPCLGGMSLRISFMPSGSLCPCSSPCSSPLTDREWAVLLSLLVVGGRLRKSRTALLVSRRLLCGLTLAGGGRCSGVLGPAARLLPLPGLSRAPPDLDSSDPSLRSDDDDSIRGRFAAPPPRSDRRLPRPRGRGVLSTTVSWPRGLLHESRPVVVSSEPESESLELICVNDPGSSPSVCVISPSSCPEPSCSLPVSVGCGTLNVRKADGRRWSRRLPPYLTLVSAIVFPQRGFSHIGPVGLVPFDVVEPLPPIQLEACSIFLLVERVVVLHTLPVSGVQVVLPVLKGGVRLAYLSRAVRASVPLSPYPLMLAPFVLPQVSSLHLFPALGARYLLMWVCYLSGPPAALGWLAVRSTRLNELISMSASSCYIVPVHPLAGPPVLFRLADFRASPF